MTSFVHPKVVPQLQDAEQVMARIARRPGTRYAALVPNDKGAVRAVDAGVDAIHTVVSASESHNLANVNMTIAEIHGQAAGGDAGGRAREGPGGVRRVHLVRLSVRGRRAVRSSRAWCGV